MTSAGAGAGAGGLGASGVLVNQVQVLNMYGCIGGSEGSPSFKAFSDGFGESKS